MFRRYGVLPKIADPCEVVTLVAGLLSSGSGGIPGEDEADNVVDPPLEDLDESPFGPPSVRPRSKRRGEGGDMAGVEDTDAVELLVGVVLATDVIEVKVVVRFFCAFSGTLENKILLGFLIAIFRMILDLPFIVAFTQYARSG